LLLNDLTGFDRHNPYLEEPEIRDRMAIYLTYLDQEKDLRGYVSPQKGWAHGMAHVADSLGMLSCSPYLNDLDLMQLLNGVAAKLRYPMPSVYLHSEEERLARAVATILQQDRLRIEQVKTWLQKLTEPQQRLPSGHFVWDDFAKYPWRKVLTAPIEQLCAYRNVQNSLRSLYFQWQNRQDPGHQKDLIQQQIHQSLQFIEIGFYNAQNGWLLS
jgi:hypothetical protein